MHGQTLEPEHDHDRELQHVRDERIEPEPVEFPPIAWLGYGIDMTAATPMDIGAAAKYVVMNFRIIDIPGLNGNNADNRNETVDGVLYRVPNVIRTGKDVTFVSGNLVAYPDGSKAHSAFENPVLPSSYFAVTGDRSVAEATNKMFRRDNQYAFYAYAKGKYLATLTDLIDHLNVTRLRSRAERMPKVFSGEDPATVKAYKEFFQAMGTHIITKVSYGARFQMNLWASNDDPSVAREWGNDVNYFFGGIPSGGKIFDPTVNEQPQYLKFQTDLQRLISASSGDNTAAITLVQDPTEYTNFTGWTDSLKDEQNNVGRAAILGMVVSEIWTLMKLADDDIVVEYGRELQKAFTWIVSNPAVYKTAVTLDVQSDWAEFGLLTPSAVVIPGEDVPENSQFSTTKFIWGKEHSHKYERKTISFYIINDGYPVDFYISHGSSGGGSSNGTAIVVMEGEAYKNDKITDNNWNTQWYYKARVSAQAEKFQLRVPEGRPGKDKDGSKRGPWDELLTQYLQEIQRKE